MYLIYEQCFLLFNVSNGMDTIKLPVLFCVLSSVFFFSAYSSSYEYGMRYETVPERKIGNTLLSTLLDDWYLNYFATDNTKKKISRGTGTLLKNHLHTVDNDTRERIWVEMVCTLKRNMNIVIGR